MNTMATVHVPSASADAVTEGGMPAARDPGIKFLKMVQGGAVYWVGSGNYTFRTSL